MSVIVAHPVATPCSTASQTLDVILPAQICAVVSPTATENIDCIATASFRGVKWLVMVAKLDASEVESFEVFATHQNGITCSHNFYSRLNDLINFTADVVIVGASMCLQITNNELVDLLVQVTQIPIPVNNTVLSIPTLGVAPVEGIHVYDPASSSVVADSVSLQFRTVKWLISVTDYTNTKRKVLEVYASQRDGVVAVNNAYVLVGDYLDIIPSVSLLGTFMELNVQNNELVPVMLDITRIPIAACYETNCTCTDITIKPTQTTITAGNTLDVDTVSRSAYPAVKWLIAVTDSITFNTEQYQLFAVNDPATDYTQYSLLGPSVSHTFALSLSGVDFTLSMTNTGLNTIQVDVVRLPIMV